MHYGVVMFATEYAMAPDQLARALEERGFESVWFPEHTHIPASRRSPWPGGGDLPREYWSSYDPFVALMAAGAATKRLKLGTGICLVIERDPITTAKEVATLDRLSAACCSGSAAAGTPRRWRTTAPRGSRAGDCCASACWR
jgi:alkanesulfonate monooxygenase SsuD/methylene tetrahydromethanopterin reductase-like flavin-dependent oxidoreductase (luciferase family)